MEDVKRWADCWPEFLISAPVPEDYRAFLHPVDWKRFRGLASREYDYNLDKDPQKWEFGWVGALTMWPRFRWVGRSVFVPPGTVVFAPRKTRSDNLLVCPGSAIPLPVCKLMGGGLTSDCYIDYVPNTVYADVRKLVPAQPWMCDDVPPLSNQT